MHVRLWSTDRGSSEDIATATRPSLTVQISAGPPISTDAVERILRASSSQTRCYTTLCYFSLHRASRRVLVAANKVGPLKQKQDEAEAEAELS